MGLQAAWLFTRERESVRLEVHATQSGGFSLVVMGPGNKLATYDFPDATNLVNFQASYEQHLRAQGFAFEGFMSERRRVPR
jgi:hypothetical protein